MSTRPFFYYFASYLNKNDFGGPQFKIKYSKLIRVLDNIIRLLDSLIIGRIPPNIQSCVTRSSLLVRNDLGCVCVGETSGIAEGVYSVSGQPIDIYGYTTKKPLKETLIFGKYI